MPELTVHDKNRMAQFESVVGRSLASLEKYTSGEWSWYELWDFNFQGVQCPESISRCLFESIKKSGGGKGYPYSIRDLERFGCKFTLLAGEKSFIMQCSTKVIMPTQLIMSALCRSSKA